MNVLYTRISTAEQNASRQMKEGFDMVFPDECSGSIPLNERKEGSKLIKMVQNGRIESITVHSIDRLGRNVAEILANVELFNSRLVCVISEKEGVRTLNPDKSPNPIAKLILSVLGSIAEFELIRIKERQKEGIAKLKEKNGYAGRSEGSTESVEAFMNKAKSQKILKTLKQGYSLRQTALLCKASTGLVIKVRDLNIRSIPAHDEKKPNKNEDKLQVWLNENQNKVEYWKEFLKNNPLQ
jgi:DNA invertase Pin-like site-specific DNA recombinase